METYYPDDLGFETAEADELRGGTGLEETAGKFVDILRGSSSGGAANKTQRDVVIANAAFAMRLIKPELSFADHCRKAMESLGSGAAWRALEILRGN